MAFDYRQVSDLYRTLKSAGVVQDDLPSWSSEMNRLSGTDLYSAGLSDNWVKRTSTGLDRLLEATGLPMQTAKFGRVAGELVGNPEAGERIGRSLPRMTANFAPMFIPGVGLAGLAATGALSGADTYTATDSPAAGLLAAATNMALPGVARAAEQFALKKLGGTLLRGPISGLGGLSQINMRAPANLFQGFASQGAGQAGAALFVEGSGFGQDVLAGQPLHNPFSTETLLNLTLGQLPFAGLYATKSGRASLGGETTKNFIQSTQENITTTRKALDDAEAIRLRSQRTPLEEVPDPTAIEPTIRVAAETQFELQKLRNEIATLEPTPENAVLGEQLAKREAELMASTQFDPTATAGVKIVPETTRQDVHGIEIHRNASGTFRLIQPVGPDGLPDFTQDPIGYSTKGERAPTDTPLRGVRNYAVPDGFHSRFKLNDKNRAALMKSFGDPTQPELTFEGQAPNFDHVAALSEAETQILVARNETEKQAALVKLNGVRESFGIAPLTDGQIARRMQINQQDQRSALSAEVKRTKRKIAAIEDSLTREQERVRASGNLEGLATAEGVVENRGTVSGTPIVPLPKRDLDTAPIHEIVEDVVAGTMANTRSGQEFAIDTEKYKIYLELRETGEISRETLNAAEAQLLREAWDAEGLFHPDTAETFLAKPQVVALDKAVMERVKQVIARNETASLSLEHDPSKLHPKIEDEIAYHAQTYRETEHEADEPTFSRASAVKEMMQDMDIKDTVPYEIRKQLQDLGIELGVFKANTKEQIDAIYQTSGKKYDFKRGDVYYTFESFDPLTVLDAPITSSKVLGETADGESRPFLPTSPEDATLVQEIVGDGTGIYQAQRLARSSNPFYAELGKLALEHPEMLARVEAAVWELPGTSRTFNNWQTKKTRIQLSHALLMADPESVDHTAAHELYHALTKSELNDPANEAMLEKFDGLRRHLIRNLPSDMKASLEKALASDWIRRFVNDQASVEELHPDRRKRSVLYGLLNMDEFASQSFTSPSLRKFMQSVKSEKVTAWGRFTGLVKQLLRMGESVDNTAFGDFLAAVDPILKQGEYVASLKNFSERYLEGQGLREQDVATQSRKVMDLVVDAQKGTSSTRLFDRLLTRPWPKSEAVQMSEKKANLFFQSKSDDALGAAGVLAELGFTQNKNGLDELIDSAVNGENVAEALDLLPAQAAEYVYTKVDDLRTTLDTLRAATSSKNDGLVNITDPQMLRGPTKDALKTLDQILESEKVHNEAVATIQHMLSGTPDAFFDRFASKSLPDEEQNVPKRGGILPFLGDIVGKYGGDAVARFLEPGAQIARSNPVFAEWFAKAQMFQARVRNATTNSLKIFGRPILPDGTVGPENTKEEMRKFEKAIASGKVRNALNGWNYANQAENPSAVVMLPKDHPKVKEVLKGLSTEEVNTVQSIMDKIGVSKKAQDQETLGALHDDSASLGARLLFKSGLKTEHGTTLASEMLHAARANFADPMEAQVANAKISAVQQKLAHDPDAFLSLVKFTQTMTQKYKELETHLNANPFWVTAIRGGKFLFEYTKNGEVVLASANSRKDAEGQAEGRAITNFRERPQQDYDVPDLGPVIEKLREFDRNAMDMLAAKGVDVADLREMERLSAVTAFERYAAATQSVDNLITPPRGLKKGAQYLPWFENYIDWVGRNSSYWQRRLLRTQSGTMLMEPEVIAAPETHKMIKTHTESLLSPDPEAAKVMQKFVTTWAMGFNAATAIANAPQTFQRGASELIAMGAGPIEAVRLISKTWKDYIGHKVSDKPWNTPEEQKFVADAVNDGMVDTTMIDENAQELESLSTNLKRAINKQKPQTKGERLGTFAGAYSQAAMWLFRQGERANNTVGLLTAFRFLKQKNPTWGFEQLKQQAYEFNSSVNDVGGRANRPIGLYSGQGAFPRTAAMTVGAMQSYTLGSTFQLIRYLKSGLFRPEGLTPSQVWSARKAATYMLGTQLAAAGVLGLPFVSGALALLDKAFPELELNRRFRETVSGLFSSDESNGNIISDVAMSGVPSMMGWDFQSRLSQGNILPGVSEYNGFQPEQLLGVPANIVKNFVNGGRRVATGDPSGGYSFVPPAFKKLAELVGEQGTVRDFKNRPLFEPTAGEKVGVALGFNPKRLSDFNAAQRMAEQNQDVQSRREGQFRQSLAEQVLKGNLGTARQELVSRINEDASFDSRQAIQGIARAAEELTFPRDLRREGSSGTSKERSRLLASFGLSPAVATEESRLVFRKGVEAKLGLPGQVSQQELSVTRLMDQLRSQNPEATRSELRRAAETAVRRTQPSQPVLQ